jgi:hypothetical protein
MPGCASADLARCICRPAPTFTSAAPSARVAWRPASGITNELPLVLTGTSTICGPSANWSRSGSPTTLPDASQFGPEQWPAFRGLPYRWRVSGLQTAIARLICLPSIAFLPSGLSGSASKLPAPLTAKSRHGVSAGQGFEDCWGLLVGERQDGRCEMRWPCENVALRGLPPE